MQQCEGQMGFHPWAVAYFLAMVFCFILGHCHGSEESYIDTLIKIAAIDPEDQPQAVQAMIDELGDYTKLKCKIDNRLKWERERLTKEKQQRQSKKEFGNSEKILDEESGLLKNELV
jgi:hypothetical protein